MRSSSIIPLALVALALTACTRGPEGSGRRVSPPSEAERNEERAERPAAAAPAEPEMRAIAGGLTWDAHEPLAYRAPENEMRVAEYDVRGHAGTTLAVFHFPAAQGGGGDVQSNIDRWLGQLTQPDGRETREVARIERRDANGLPITIVDARGTFVGRLGMGQGGGERPGWRVLGAIAEGPNGGVFFKMIGPEAGVAAAEQAFDELVSSIRPI